MDDEEVLGIFSENKSRARMLFKEFSDEEKLNEGEALKYMESYLYEKKIGFEQLNQKEYTVELELLVKELKDKSDLSLHRIAEVIGISREKVRKILVSKEPSP